MEGRNMYDLIIKNGNIIDGTGSPSFIADIAIEGGKIVRIDKGIEGGVEVIDARGLVVAPGFIDSHSHSDTAVFTYPDQMEKIEQGITTSIAGQCGLTPAPVSRDVPPEKAAAVGDFGLNTEVYRTMGSFLKAAREVPQGANIAMFVGHCALRQAVMGMENRAPSERELNQMKELLREGIENGALGVSFGLIYPPSCYAAAEELIALARVAEEYHGLVTAHIRDEGDYLIESTAEFIRIIKEAGVRGIISHHKSMGRENWGKVNHTLRMIEEANAQGADIYCDAYPYDASHTTLSVRFIPKEYHSYGLNKVLADPAMRKEIKEWGLKRWGDDYSWVLITDCSDYPEYEGLRIPEIARIHGKDEYDTIFDLVEKDNDCHACFFMMSEEDIETVLAYSGTMICTDSSVAEGSTCYHPRLLGSFPRVLGRYVRERKVTTLPDMIRKMTSMPASVYGLKGKGLLKEGYDADICIFDAERIIDRAEFTNCCARAKGLNCVIVNGKVAVKDAVYQGIRAGKVIMRGE